MAKIGTIFNDTLDASKKGGFLGIGWINEYETTVAGDLGHDEIIGSIKNDRLYGGFVGDRSSILISDGNDTRRGEDGHDSLFGEGDDDKLVGNSGNDYLDESSSSDSLYGSSGNNTWQGEGHNDSLFGEGDDDKLVSNSGNDYLDGGFGSDSLEVNLTSLSSIIESNGIQIQFHNLSESFDPNQSTYVLTHGWQNSPSTWANDMASTLLYQSPNSNVITVDWSEIAGSLNYFSVVDAVPIVGSAIANYLQDLGINPQETQLIGHSLGAHASGIAGDLYNELTGYQIDTIVGLDPAGIDFEPELFIFSGAPESERLDPSDANQVIAFHTSSILGYDPRLADLDLYINPEQGLSSQPGKKDFIGNHMYATELYNQLLRGKSFTQTDTVSAIGPWFNLSDLNLTGSFDINTFIEAGINDLLEGGDGNDDLFGRNGNNSLEGGDGADTFVFDSLSTEIDTITDFEVSIDTIQIGSEFGASYNSQFSFDDTNGVLSFEGQQFATLSNYATLGDFDVSREIVLV